MPNITVALTDTQNKCLEYAAADVQDWADNALHNRARIAQEEIIAALVAHCNANEIALATGADAQVAQAFELEVVKTAAQRNAEAETPPE
tara:strand:+ start:4540 stop:4809 length:270 start_codon:yes stop_codon:yes gene_type:complete